MLGVHLSPPDDRDFLVGDVPHVLPEKHHIPGTFTVRDQGFCGVCVGKAGASILSASHKKPMSTLYLYTRCKELDGIPDQQGTFPRVALKVMQKEGSCPDAVLPYVLQNCLRLPRLTEQMRDAAAPYRIGSYARCYSTQDIKRSLVDGHPVLAVILVGDNFIEYKTGVIGMPTGQLHGYHAVVLTGYDNSKQAFRGVNSWSERWGEDGCFWLDYDVTTVPGWFPEAWSVTTTGGEEKMEQLKSRKFILAVVSAILVILNEGLGWHIPEETVMQFIYLILGWIFAEAAVDIKRAK